MAKKIQQFRYYPKGVSVYPEGLKASGLSGGGNAFANYLPIIQLGIQTLPGVKFRLNGASNEIIVGSTGIYELDVSDGAAITMLSFDAASLKMIDESGTGYLIVDILYDNSN